MLTQASVLTVSSYATRTSPVLRGKWILDNLLNAPPPDPPPDVPRLDEASIGDGGVAAPAARGASQGSDLRVLPRRMDPLGFGLENFDAIGAWRTRTASSRSTPPASCPTAKSSRGRRSCAACCVSQRDAFARCLTEKLMTYALGRGLERYDTPHGEDDRATGCRPVTIGSRRSSSRS